MMYPKTVYIHTIGCQMNVYDSERIAGGLAPLGYRQVSEPETADLIILNTCAIREKAEQKVFSFLGRMAGLKRKNPELIIGVGGCVAQQEGRKILDRAPYLDLVFGTHAVSRLPALVQQVETTGGRLVDVALSETIQESPIYTVSPDADQISRFVTIMQGCDNYCTYCVVPYVRGREMSRSPERILSEIQALADSGIREVTLLGQNVNSYGKKEGLCDFSELLTRMNGIEGLLRIRFTTSHPKDLSDDLIATFNRLDKLCRHIHLPVQSGSTRILSRMNRKYTRDMYLEKIARLRDICPDIAITSDIIVGFPGETSEDFEDTLSLIRQVAYDGLFAFMYSDRPNAPAAHFPKKISEAEKAARLQQVLGLQETITVEKNQSLVHSVQVVLVEGVSQRMNAPEASHEATPQWYGRTPGHKIVHFPEPEQFGASGNIGGLKTIRIEKAFSHSLWGRPVSQEE
ncbi:MAG: tRNA (N6-isopentenyl adenosine(37)-C2)-methylthiotransferase MiaB [Pseudomonadota bacterium]